MDTSLTTELDAVNLMLSVIGESPVNSLDSTGLSDVAIAKNILKEVSLEVQDDGWTFNQEDNVTLPLDSDGFVTVPPNALRVERMSDDTSTPQFTVRGSRLYDRDNHTYTFKAAPRCQITYFLDYMELPQAARFYIAIRAARKFQKRNVSSGLLEKFSEQDELDALANMQDQDTSAGDYNILTGNWDVARIHLR